MTSLILSGENQVLEAICHALQSLLQVNWFVSPPQAAPIHSSSPHSVPACQHIFELWRTLHQTVKVILSTHDISCQVHGGNCAIGHAAQCFNSRNQEWNNWCYLHYLALAQKNPIIYRKCYQIGMMEPQFYLLPLWNLSCQIQFLFNSNFIYTASCGASSTAWSARLIVGIICLLHLEFCETYLSWLYRQTYLECSQGRYVH